MFFNADILNVNKYDQKDLEWIAESQEGSLLCKILCCLSSLEQDNFTRQNHPTAAASLAAASVKKPQHQKLTLTSEPHLSFITERKTTVYVEYLFLTSSISTLLKSVLSI